MSQLSREFLPTSECALKAIRTKRPLFSHTKKIPVGEEWSQSDGSGSKFSFLLADAPGVGVNVTKSPKSNDVVPGVLNPPRKPLPVMPGVM